MLENKTLKAVLMGTRKNDPHTGNIKIILIYRKYGNNFNIRSIISTNIKNKSDSVLVLRLSLEIYKTI